MYYFTADQHFDHTNIMKYLNRPWRNVQDMNEALIENYNEIVTGADVVVIAGDITLHTNHEFVKKHFLDRLNGNKILLKGNHDYWLREKRYMYHRRVNGQFIAVSHYPMRSWKNSIHGSWNLHGHSHGTLEPYRNQLDVGVDSAYRLLGEYRPFSFDEVKSLIEERRANE
jgi:calcineurin-like phosphoesterase family protein